LGSFFAVPLALIPVIFLQTSVKVYISHQNGNEDSSDPNETTNSNSGHRQEVFPCSQNFRISRKFHESETWASTAGDQSIAGNDTISLCIINTAKAPDGQSSATQ
jgi:hypothetical protein